MIKINVCFLLIVICILGNCAKQQPPPGGPVDKAPPEIIKVFPTSNSILVDRDTKITIEFSERVQAKSVEDAIFISPRHSEDPAYKWKRGRKLIIEFPDSLKKDRTYVLTIGTDAVDLRRNRMENSFQLAFSTGEKLDQGRISGTVYGNSGIEGTIIGAYTLQPEQEVNPAQITAEYVTQCNTTGDYRLSYIAPDNYRLFAINDKDGNGKYNNGYDGIGIPTTDVTLTEDQLSVDNINFQIAVKDTILPGIKSVIDINQHHVDIRFDGPLAQIKKVNPQFYFSITGEETKEDTLEILSFFPNSLDGSRFHLKTGKQDSGRSYIIVARNLFDLAGNPIDTTYNSYVFSGSSLPDTLQPTLIFQSIKDKTKEVPLNSAINLIFSEALICSTFEQHFALTDSNEVEIKGSYLRKNPTDFTFVPDTKLASQMTYFVHVTVDSVFDEFGNSLADSAIDFKFTTVNKDTLSAINGIVKDNLTDAKGKIHLIATLIGSQNITYNTVLDSAGLYMFDEIFPGIYSIYGFIDADSNGVYSYGQVIPFVPAERFLFLPDSIKVRSRWLNEGNDLFFREY